MAKSNAGVKRVAPGPNASKTTKSGKFTQAGTGGKQGSTKSLKTR